MKKYEPQACKRCPGEGENCKCCIYAYCRKLVDEKLVFYKFNKNFSTVEEFQKWFKAYFNL